LKETVVKTLNGIQVSLARHRLRGHHRRACGLPDLVSIHIVLASVRTIPLLLSSTTVQITQFSSLLI
jgi:hypothetical protein